jgi:uncharacterized protein YdbL (DUF1318 family)
MKGKLRATAALLAGLVLLAAFAPAESAELKARFLERKPLLEKMKDLGWVGENNLGFLVFRGDEGKNKENVQLIKAENEDRGVVYAEIAVKVKTSAEEVGKRRAAQIAKLAAAGHWLQDADGNWYQKR